MFLPPSFHGQWVSCERNSVRFKGRKAWVWSADQGDHQGISEPQFPHLYTCQPLRIGVKTKYPNTWKTSNIGLDLKYLVLQRVPTGLWVTPTLETAMFPSSFPSGCSSPTQSPSAGWAPHGSFTVLSNHLRTCHFPLHPFSPTAKTSPTSGQRQASFVPPAFSQQGCFALCSDAMEQAWITHLDTNLYYILIVIFSLYLCVPSLNIWQAPWGQGPGFHIHVSPLPHIALPIFLSWISTQ